MKKLKNKILIKKLINNKLFGRKQNKLNKTKKYKLK